MLFTHKGEKIEVDGVSLIPQSESKELIIQEGRKGTFKEAKHG